MIGFKGTYDEKVQNYTFRDNKYLNSQIPFCFFFPEEWRPRTATADASSSFFKKKSARAELRLAVELIFAWS